MTPRDAHSVSLPLNRSLGIGPDDEPVAAALDDLLRYVVVRQGGHLSEEECPLAQNIL